MKRQTHTSHKKPILATWSRQRRKQSVGMKRITKDRDWDEIAVEHGKPTTFG